VITRAARTTDPASAVLLVPRCVVARGVEIRQLLLGCADVDPWDICKESQNDLPPDAVIIHLFASFFEFKFGAEEFLSTNRPRQNPLRQIRQRTGNNSRQRRR